MCRWQRRVGSVELTSTDYVAALLERSEQRAEVEGFEIEYETADAEALPFADGSFDYVASSFGVMFTPNQDQAAAELLRVARSGGKIGLANWTPQGFIGQLFRTIGGHVAPPAGLKSPALWGTEERLREMFGAEAASIRIEKQNYVWRYRSPQHWLDMWREVYGPLQKAFGTLDVRGQAALAADLIALIERFNAAADGTMVVSSEYLEVVIEKD